MLGNLAVYPLLIFLVLAVLGLPVAFFMFLYLLAEIVAGIGKGQ